MEYFTLARVVHVISVILWIGGVSMVTTVLIPEIKKMKLFLTAIVVIFSKLAFCQYSEVSIYTDSSDIKITTNSIYIIKEESYHNKDSVWYSVLFTKDSSVCRQGWKDKNGNYIGLWSEYSQNGVWLNTIDYTNATMTYNPNEYYFQNSLDSIKLIADSLIIDIYGYEFFKKHVKFKFNGSTNRGGMWTDPIKVKPTVFSLKYCIQLDDKHLYYDKIEINLDSLGKIIPTSNPGWLNFNDRIKTNTNYFNLTYDKAISICIKNGLIISDTMKFEADLKYIFWKSSPYAGNFIFKVTQHLPPVVTEGICPIKCKTETLYREWIINPWNSELLEHKRYKRLDQWSNGNGGGESIEIKD